MGSQPAQPQGLPPGETPQDEQSRLDAVGTVIGVVAAIVFALVVVSYVGGFGMHVLFDIARSGWESK